MPTSIHLNYVLGTLPLGEALAAARRSGFDAVENPFPYGTPASRYASLLRDNDLEQISIGAPACDYKGGQPGYSLTPEFRSEFDRSIDTVIDYAKTIACNRVHIFAGPKAAEVSPELAFDTYCGRLAEAHDRLEREGLIVVIEAVNSGDFPGYFMNRLDFALEALAHIDRPSIGIVLDVYHACVNKEDPLAFLRQHGQRVSHVQLADYPGRHEPGTGSFDFAALFDVLRVTDYRGSIGLEYVPTRSIVDGVPLMDLLRLTPSRETAPAEADPASPTTKGN